MTRIGRTLIIIVAALMPAAASAAPLAAEEDPVERIKVIVSPAAAPACLQTGTVTFFAPIVPLILVDNGVPLPGGFGSTVLDALGPVYVVCGSLPASPGTRCAIDATIVGFIPPEAAQAGVTPPSPMGILIDSLAALGADPNALANPLECDVIPVPGGEDIPSGELAVPPASPAPPPPSAPPPSIEPTSAQPASPPSPEPRPGSSRDVSVQPGAPSSASSGVRFIPQQIVRAAVSSLAKLLQLLLATLLIVTVVRGWMGRIGMQRRRLALLASTPGQPS